MIKQLRERHFRLAILLAIVVPLVLILALMARRQFPTQPIPAPLAGRSPE